MNAENSNRVLREDSQDSKPSQDETSERAGAVLKSARGKKSASAFRTISEVADELGVQQHVLRFWETKFAHIKPLKRGGGRRYYRPEDVSLLQAIYKLLYVEGYTIKGVQKLLREAGKKRIIDNFSNTENQETTKSFSADHAPQPAETSGKLNGQQRKALEDILAELKELRGMVKPNSK